MNDLNQYLRIPSENTLLQLDSNSSICEQSSFSAISAYFDSNELFTQKANELNIGRIISEAKDALGWSNYTAEEKDMIER